MKWLRPHSDDLVPEYLIGEYPDVYGWDATGLAADSKVLEKYREAEVIHSRWAVLDTFPSLTAELLAQYASVPIAKPLWFKAGAQISFEGVLDYLRYSGLIHALYRRRSGLPEIL